MEPPFPPIPGFPRTFFLRETRDLETAPPPHGFDSWDAYWTVVVKGEGLTTYISPGTVPRGKKASMVFTRVGEDVAVCGLHFTHVDGPEVIDWTSDEYDTIESGLEAVWTTIKGLYNADTALDRIVWHDFGVGVRKPNPAVRETILASVPGANDDTNQLPPQTAMSVTFKTSSRRQWGRVYLPAPAITGNVASGRIPHGLVDSIRTAFGVLLDDALTHSIPQVIWSPRNNGGPLKYGKANHDAGLDTPDSSSFARTVNQVQVDDLFDTMRSRRFDKASYYATHTAGA